MSRQAQGNSYDKHLIFREVFNDKSITLKNGGVPTDVSFENGRGVFNGSSSHVKFSPTIVTNNGGFWTFRAKFKITNLKENADGIFACRDSTGISGIVLSVSNRLEFRSNGSAEVESGELEENVEYDVIVTCNTSYIELYINGSFIDSFADAGLFSNNDYWYVGWDDLSNDRHAAMELDFVEVYDTYMPDEEVQNLVAGRRYKDVELHCNILDVSGKKGFPEDAAHNNIQVSSVGTSREGTYRAMSFKDSDNSSITVPHTDRWLIGDNSFTIAVMAKLPAYEDGIKYIFDKDDGSTGFFLQSQADGTVKAFVRGSSDQSAIVSNSVVFKPGVVRIVSMVYDAVNEEQKIFIDGVLDKTGATGSIGSIDTTRDLNLALNFDGLFYNFKFWDICLSDNEVATETNRIKRFYS